MAYTNNNKKVHDTPVWLPTNQFRTVTSATASMTVSKDTMGRYIYYLAGTLFYRYDTWKDVHQKLASPPVAAVTASSIKYSPDEGYRGNCLSSSDSGMTIAGLNGSILVGKQIRITAGLGIGQEKTIIASTDTYIEECGIASGTTSATNLQDINKRWEINQYIGYQVRIVYNTGQSQVRKILYNNSNTLFFQDSNFQQVECWNNTAFSATAPYAVPVTTAGNIATFYIESNVITIDGPWDIRPDATSSYVIIGGGVFMLSAFATTPFSSFQYYDVLSDTWTNKTALGGNLLVALGTDFSIEIITKEQPFATGTTTSGTTRTVQDTTKNFIVDRYVNYELRIIDGNAMGSKSRIVANGSNYFEAAIPFPIIPETGSTYEIRGTTKMIYAVGNGASSIYQYSIENDAWFTGPIYDYGETRNMSVQFLGQEAFAITTGARNVSGITALNPSPSNGGSGYVVGDLFNITTVGTVGKGRVESVSAGGVVTRVSLYSAGIGYSPGGSKATTKIAPCAGNDALTVNITSVGVVGRITCPTATNFYSGDSVIITGDGSASPWNGTYNILAIDANTTTTCTFDIIISSTTSMAASFSQTTVLIVDSTKNWVANEHIGKLVKLDVAGVAPTTQIRRITGNTPTTLSVATITAGANGTSRYVITSPYAFGRERQYDRSFKRGEGRATSGTATSLVDTTKDWFVNQWVNYRVRIMAGTGVGSEIVISANDATELTLTTPGFTPDSTTKYTIMSSYGTATSGNATTLVDNTKNWTVNQWAGKRIVITGGLSQRAESTISSNTATQLTFATITTLIDTTTTYTILAIPPRSTGTELRWVFGNDDTFNNKGNFLMCPRGGGSNVIDRYSINTDEWDFTSFYSPQSETLAGGSSYCYDGVNNFYYSIGLASDFIYIHSLNVHTMQSNGAFQTTALQGATAHIGNLMEIVTSDDGGKFLFVAINTSRLMYKTLIY